MDDGERAYFDHARRTLLPLIRGSAVYLGICPAEPDAKFALELGVAILYDKPLLFIVPKGRTVPAKVRRVADAVIEVDDIADPRTQERIAAVVKEFAP
jgi:hypothetical protein